MKTSYPLLSTTLTRALAGGIVLLSLLFVPGKASAAPENYRPFRFDLGGLYAQMYGTGDKGGGLLLEPMFNITDQISAGFRQEIVFAGGGSFGGTDSSSSARVQMTSLAKGEYYITMGSPIRPFVGLGAGLYYIVAGSASVKVSNSTPTSTAKNATTVSGLAGSYFGFAPQIGIELGVFRLSILYEAILGAAAEARASVFSDTPGKVVSSKRLDYIGFEMSFRLGGGRLD